MPTEITDEQIAELRRLLALIASEPTEFAFQRVLATKAVAVLPALLSRLERAEKAVKVAQSAASVLSAAEVERLHRLGLLEASAQAAVAERESLLARDAEMTERLERAEKERDEARADADGFRNGQGQAQADFEAVMDSNKVMAARIATLEAALRDCEDYFDQRADADCAGDPAAYAGNREMTLLGIVRRALRGLEGK